MVQARSVLPDHTHSKDVLAGWWGSRRCEYMKRDLRDSLSAIIISDLILLITSD